MYVGFWGSIDCEAKIWAFWATWGQGWRILLDCQTEYLRGLWGWKSISQVYTCLCAKPAWVSQFPHQEKCGAPRVQKVLPCSHEGSPVSRCTSNVSEIHLYWRNLKAFHTKANGTEEVYFKLCLQVCQMPPSEQSARFSPPTAARKWVWSSHHFHKLHKGLWLPITLVYQQ